MEDIKSYIRNELRKLNTESYDFRSLGLDDHQSLLLSLYSARNNVSVSIIIQTYLQNLCDDTKAAVEFERLVNSDVTISASGKVYLNLDTRTMAILSALINHVEPKVPDPSEKVKLRGIQDTLHRKRKISIKQLYSVAINSHKFYSGEWGLIEELIAKDLFQVTKSGNLDLNKRLKRLQKIAKSQDPQADSNI